MSKVATVKNQDVSKNIVNAIKPVLNAGKTASVRTVKTWFVRKFMNLSLLELFL